MYTKTTTFSPLHPFAPNKHNKHSMSRATAFILINTATEKSLSPKLNQWTLKVYLKSKNAEILKAFNKVTHFPHTTIFTTLGLKVNRWLIIYSDLLSEHNTVSHVWRGTLGSYFVRVPLVTERLANKAKNDLLFFGHRRIRFSPPLKVFH